MSRTSFTFLVHPRTRLDEDPSRVWTPLGRVPEEVDDAALRRLPVAPVTIAGVEVRGERVGHVVLVPFGARHLLDKPAEGRARVARAVDRAVALGSGVVGLGALTATVTAGGVARRNRTDIAVTNGNAFTAATVDTQARHALDHVVVGGGRRVAVVGATGSVGTAVTRLLARDGAVEQVTLVSRTAPRLEALAAEVGSSVPTATSTDLGAVAGADLVVLLTASADTVIGPTHLRPGAVVLDATQPRSTTPELLVERPDVVVLDGGVVDVPSLRLPAGDLGIAYACYAETAVLARSGRRRHPSIGDPGLDLVERTRGLAADLAHLGFVPAAPTSFGCPFIPRLTVPGAAAA